ncbi:hypothetical protein F4802DRAFT_584038 [Xylaria palmicola]|nr:hypothetical protein F4802DRAFT_584038 [Xylaria palmicola]
MKILCLHGHNQNGQIFQGQLSETIKEIKKFEAGVSLDFADAPVRCASPLANGKAVYKFFDAPVVAEIAEAREWLASKLDADGPYDGVISFAEGATLVSSYLLYHQWYCQEQSPPFRFAVFIGGGILLEVLKDLGILVPRVAEHAVEEAERRRDGNLGPSPSQVSLARQALFNSDDCFGLNLNKIPLELKVKIPTAHVWGENDPCFPSSIHLVSLCDPYIRKIYVHSNAHEVPQETEDNYQLGQLVLWCIQRASWPGRLQAQWEGSQKNCT